MTIPGFTAEASIYGREKNSLYHLTANIVGIQRDMLTTAFSDWNCNLRCIAKCDLDVARICANDVDPFQCEYELGPLCHIHCCRQRAQ
jgi:hypothetical protein